MPAHPVRLLLLLVALAGPASAQMLPSGTWTGELVRDGERSPVAAELERCAGGFTLALDVGGRTAEVPEDTPATWRRGTLAFETGRFRLPGTLLPRRLACTLAADDAGGLAGTCTWADEPVTLRLSPPADAAFSCD